MKEFSEILELDPYSLNKNEKRELLCERLGELTLKHMQSCYAYGKIIRYLYNNNEKIKNIEDVPFLPVQLFKECDLKSVPDDEVIKIMTSSGTTGQKVSKIYLDKETASNQQKTLVKIVSSYTGKSRLPMLIIDNPNVLKDRKMFSARGAAILGFSILASDRIYALNDDMTLDIDGVKSFLEKHKNQKILVFGFTFMIWKFFYEYLKKTRQFLELENAVLIHGGGWKKLINESVDDTEYKRCLKKVCGVENVHDYYGMVEQTGCIYMQCECGYLHSSIFSDVIMRRKDFSVCDFGEKGIIQTISLLPESYPGHSILTEDEGYIIGEDDCKCGRKGKYFKVLGRIKNAEIRGCSDTYEDK